MGPEVVGDIQELPLADGSVDAALAMHMLYHVPDIALAARELRRVVRPGGVLMASTNAADDKAEVGELWAAAVEDLTGSRPVSGSATGGSPPTTVACWRRPAGT
jgi:ubiquinone/menaquinone biosynthesis C-methylase UbiE